MFKRVAISMLVISLFSGCATVPMESKQHSSAAKEFNPPQEGYSGLYIYRLGGPGTALKKDVWIDGECVGETAPNMFFYLEVEGDKEYVISTESEFSPNDLVVMAKSGEIYFVKQYIRLGVFVGGANLKLVDRSQGEKDVAKLELALQGNCSQPR